MFLRIVVLRLVVLVVGIARFVLRGRILWIILVLGISRGRLVSSRLLSISGKFILLTLKRLVIVLVAVSVRWFVFSTRLLVTCRFSRSRSRTSRNSY